MDLTALAATGGPVAITLAIVQAIKAVDKDDILERYYSAIAIAVGLVVGGIAGWNDSDMRAVVLAGIQNAAYAALAWTAKKAVLDPAYMSIPGDPKKAG